MQKDYSNTRSADGRFGSGNPGGAPRLTPSERIARLVSKRGPDLLDLAFKQAETDNGVLAALLGYLAARQPVDGPTQPALPA